MRGNETLYEILGVPSTATPDVIRAAYRKLSRKYHPDVHPGNEAVFIRINEAYKILSDKDRRSQYDQIGSSNPLILSTSLLGKVTIGGIKRTGTIADLFRGRTEKGQELLVKVVRNPRDSDLMENEAAVLKVLFPHDKQEAKMYRRFPKLLDSIKINDGKTHRQSNIFPDYHHWHTLVDVRDAFRLDTMRFEHGIWMLNRVLEGLIYAHSKGFIHAALTPDHILAYSSGKQSDPLNHGAKIIDWAWAVKYGSKAKAFNPEWEYFYPPEVEAKRSLTPATDIYMAAKSIIYVLGGGAKDDSLPNSVPGYLGSFLRSCTLKNQTYRPQDAGELYKELTRHLETHYGPKKYFPFDMPMRA